MADETITRVVGDTRKPISAILLDGNGNPIDVAALTVQFSMVTHPAGVDEIAWTATGVTKQPTQTFTVTASTDKALCNGHGIKENDQIIVSSGTTLPAGLAASTRYFARDVTPNGWKFATEPQGSVVNITDTGTGTHSVYIVGHVQYDFSSGNVDTAGQYRAAFRIDASSEYETLPGDETVLYVNLVTRP